MAKVPKQAFFISPVSPFPALFRLLLCFCLARCQSDAPFDASLGGDETFSCWITMQITEGWRQFIAVWSGKGINPVFWLYGVALVVKPLFGDLWFTVWVTLQSKSFRAQCAEGRMFDPFAQKGNCAALL